MEDDLVQFFADGLLRVFLLPAEVPQGGGGVVQDRVLPDGTVNVVLQRSQVRQLRMPRGDGGTVDLRVLQVAAQAPHGRAEAGDRGQFRRQQHTALQRAGQACFRSLCFRQRRRAGVFHDAARGGGFLHAGAAKPFIHERGGFPKNPAGGSGNGHILQLFDDLIKSE